MTGHTATSVHHDGMRNALNEVRNAALGALRARGEAIKAELARLGRIQLDQQPLPDFVDALFDFSIGQVQAESDWIARTLDYMKCKPWHRGE